MKFHANFKLQVIKQVMRKIIQIIQTIDNRYLKKSNCSTSCTIILFTYLWFENYHIAIVIRDDFHFCENCETFFANGKQNSS